MKVFQLKSKSQLLVNSLDIYNKKVENDEEIL